MPARALMRTFALLLLGTFCTGVLAARKQTVEIAVGGISRQYILAAPDIAPAGPRPLVLVLHGHLGTAANALGAGRVPSPLAAWLTIVDREQVVVAALQGRQGSDGRTGWHDCRRDDTELPRVDDVAFARNVIAGLVRSGRVDPRRVYVMGMSNGAMMTYRLALELRPAPAAIAAVSGTMAAASECGEATTPVSVLLINGAADPIVPYAGGKVGLGNHRTGSVVGVAATRDYWLRVDGLADAPSDQSGFTHRDPKDPTSARAQSWGRSGGPQVESIVIDHGGHVEPSLRYHPGWLYSRVVGSQNRDFESVEEAWRFFRDKTGE